MARSLATETAPPSVEQAYNDALAYVERLCEGLTLGRAVVTSEVGRVVELLLQALDTHAPKIIGLTAQPSAPNFIITHSVNKCVLALATARALGYNTSYLRDVGAASLLHDIGLSKLTMGLPSQQVSYQDIKQHKAAGRAILRQHPELRHLAVYIEMEEDGATPPLTAQQLELCTVIRLVDLYDSLTHQRAERPTPTAFPAVMTIMKSRGLFKTELLKAFFNQVGIYPIGTWVRLSTGEIGVVTGIHEGLPLRPKVTLYYDRTCGRLAEGKVVDLSAEPISYVKESLEEEPRRST